MKLPCAQCKGRCCTYPVFTEKEFELVKIVHGIPDGTILNAIQHVASYDLGVHRGDKAVMIHLKDGTCPDLKSDGCSIHALRPKVCKDYGVVSNLPCEYLYPAKAKFYHQERLRRSK